MSNRPEELVQHVWSIWLISLCGQPDANLRSISEIGCEIALAVAKACEKLLLPKCIRRQAIEPRIHSWWGIDPCKAARLASRGLDTALGIARDAYCSGSNSSSQEMNPTLQRRLPLHADCYVTLISESLTPKMPKQESLPRAHDSRDLSSM